MPAEREYMGKLCVAQTVIAWAFLQTTALRSIAAKQTLQKQPLFNLISSTVGQAPKNLLHISTDTKP